MRTVVTPVPARTPGQSAPTCGPTSASSSSAFGGAPSNDVLPHLIEASCYDDQLRRSLEDYVRDSARRRCGRSSHGASTAASYRPTPTSTCSSTLVLGPFFYRRLLTGATLDQAFADRLVDHVLP